MVIITHSWKGRRPVAFQRLQSKRNRKNKRTREQSAYSHAVILWFNRPLNLLLHAGVTTDDNMYYIFEKSGRNYFKYFCHR